MKKLFLKLSLIALFGVISVVTLSQLNYEQAVTKASQVDTDGEIQSVLRDHGFEVDIYDHITVSDKVNAFFTVMSS
jgi:hypothetical protein